MSPSEQAALWLRECDGLLVSAGAGMGVDSGLPDFRGDEGFWRAYPALRGERFIDVANPRGFLLDPARAWGFYGHRLALYRRTVPHAGFAILKRWGEGLPLGVHVLTSNVDGQFQQAGFQRVAEVHGTIHHLQCTRPCCEAIWPADGFEPDVDASRCRLLNDAPRCPYCDALARPNILMFGDFAWIGARSQTQQQVLARALDASERWLIVELGAGLAIPTLRAFGERLVAQQRARLVRINPRDHETPRGALALACGALEGLQSIERARSD